MVCRFITLRLPLRFKKPNLTFIISSWSSFSSPLFFKINYFLMYALHQSYKSCFLLLFFLLSPYFESKVVINLPCLRNFHNSMSLIKVGWLLGEWLMFVINDDNNEDDAFLIECIQLAFSGHYHHSFSHWQPCWIWHVDNLASFLIKEELQDAT